MTRYHQPSKRRARLGWLTLMLLLAVFVSAARMQAAALPAPSAEPMATRLSWNRPTTPAPSLVRPTRTLTMASSGWAIRMSISAC